MEGEGEAEACRQGPATGLDVRERLVPVDVRLTLAEQVQVRAVQDQDRVVHGIPS
jgi:hypothetical protein